MCRIAEATDERLEAAEAQAFTFDLEGYWQRMEECIKMVNENAAELARLTGLKPDRFYQARRRKSALKTQASLAVAHALGLKIQWLLEGTGPKYETPSVCLPREGHIFVYSDDVPADGDLALLVFRDNRAPVVRKVFRKGNLWVGTSPRHTEPIAVYDDELRRIGKIWEVEA